MQIGKNDLLAGASQAAARRPDQNGQRQLVAKKLREELKLSPQETMDILRGLKAEGYLEASDRLRGWYRAGPAAPRLIDVRFIKRIDRAKAAH